VLGVRDRYPHGQGFSAATRLSSAGKVALRSALLILRFMPTCLERNARPGAGCLEMVGFCPRIATGVEREMLSGDWRSVESFHQTGSDSSNSKNERSITSGSGGEVRSHRGHIRRP
jgi:hypothetical protein